MTVLSSFEEKTADARACAQSGHCPFKLLSKWTPVHSAVPQGTTFGPILSLQTMALRSPLDISVSLGRRCSGTLTIYQNGQIELNYLEPEKAIELVACEAQTYFRSSLLSLRKRGEKGRPEIRVRFARYRVGCFIRKYKETGRREGKKRNSQSYT